MKFIAMLLWLPMIAIAQHRPRVSLEIQSATVWLGMPKAEALRSLESVGLNTVGKEVMFIKSGTNRIVGSIAFTHGLVSYVSRDWPTKSESELEAVIGALEALSKAGASNCQVQSAPISEPEHKATRIFIECGERSILLMRSTPFDGDGFYSAVYENIDRLAENPSN